MSRQIKHWYEEDAYTNWRYVVIAMSRAGVRKKIKRLTHKRERREAKRDLRTE